MWRVEPTISAAKMVMTLRSGGTSPSDIAFRPP